MPLFTIVRNEEWHELFIDLKQTWESSSSRLPFLSRPTSNAKD